MKMEILLLPTYKPFLGPVCGQQNLRSDCAVGSEYLLSKIYDIQTSFAPLNHFIV